jgi:hypothetical protein
MTYPCCTVFATVTQRSCNGPVTVTQRKRNGDCNGNATVPLQKRKNYCIQKLFLSVFEKLKRETQFALRFCVFFKIET